MTWILLVHVPFWARYQTNLAHRLKTPCTQTARIANMILLLLLIMPSCQADMMNDTQLICALEGLITSDEWTHLESTAFVTGTSEATLKASRDPDDVLSQFKSVQAVSVGERNLLVFLGTAQADFITRIDSAVADDLVHQVNERLQPAAHTLPCGQSTQRYRTPDARCNNQEHPSWGMAARPLRRFLPSAYGDGKKSPRRSSTGLELPSARKVSLGATDEDGEAVASTYSTLNVHFGQLLSHDLDLVPQVAGHCSSCEDSDICLPIPIPPGDPVFVDRGCIRFVRSLGVPFRRDGDQRWAHQQTNKITAYLDASFVYGSSSVTMDALKIPGDPQGLLRVTPNPSPSKMDLLPPDDEIANCAGRDGPVSCGKAGDQRAAETVGLTALHTLWLREHNRVARRLSGVNPHWDGQTIFSEARKIVGAVWQHIVYNEYLPLLLGRRGTRQHGLDVNLHTRPEYAYNPGVDATIRNAFATAALRLGHSQVPTTVWRVDQHFERVFGDIQLRESFFNATHIYDAQGGGPDSILRAMLVQPLDKVDHFFSSAVRKHLFEDPKQGFGLDLIALNIQRGRDHGLPGYVRFRAEACGLGQITTWDELANAGVMPPRIVRRLRHIYSSVEDIDPFVGFFAERPRSGALVGPTLVCLLGKQFSYLKRGDRFWYENTEGAQAFTRNQLAEIQRASMARVLCDNTDELLQIQPLAFLMADDAEASRVYTRGQEEHKSFVEYSKLYRYPNRYGRLEGFSNRRVSCQDESRIPKMNLNAWAED